jgi:hypothetical protein
MKRQRRYVTRANSIWALIVAAVIFVAWVLIGTDAIWPGIK